MRTLIDILAPGVIDGTHVSGAIILCPTIAAVDDRTLAPKRSVTPTAAPIAVSRGSAPEA